MNSQIHQMQFNYSASEDRLIFRFNTTTGEEFTFLLTRRYVKLIWPVLLNVLGGFDSAAPNALMREALLSFQHDAIMSQADLSTPFKETPKALRPLGPEPILLGQLTIKRSRQNLPILCMHPEQGKGIELVMDQTLLHSFLGLIIHAVSQSGWDLQFDLGDFSTTQKPAKVMMH
ncbi:MAG: hypothetical protein ACR2HF_10340 [Methylococcaceae bacterium]